MKKNWMKVFGAAAAAALSLSLFAGCAKTEQTALFDDGVVKAFRAVAPAEGLISQTAAKDGNAYLVTVITSSSVSEYPVGENFEVGAVHTIVGGASPTALEETAEGLSPLERAFEEALSLSGLAKADVVGFDFDRDTYMSKAAYKVEIEDAAAEYTYIFSADDFSLLSSKTELKRTDSQDGTSYIPEAQAKEIALKAAGTTESEVQNFTVKLVPENGRRLYVAGFDLGGFRYTVELDAVNGGIVKFSKSVLGENVAYPDVPQILSEAEAKEIALGFVSQNGGSGNAQFRKVKLDYEKGRFVYETELVADGKEYELEIDAASGEILDVEIDGEESGTPPQSGEFITREQAVAAVREHLAGKEVFLLDVEIEVRNTADGKRYYYEVEVKADGVELEFYVDALTGGIAANDDYTGNPLAPALTEEDALGIALGDLGLTEKEITSKRIKLEREDGRLCYEIKFFVGTTEYKIGVDANNGKILEKEIDTEHETPSRPAESGYITRSAAAEAVKAYFAAKGMDARVDENEIEWEDEGTGANKRYFYEVEAYVGGREYDCYVDALTGEVRVKGELVEERELIGEERALAIALEKFSLSKSEVRVAKVKLDEEDGVLVYEVEFKVKSMEYSFEIDAVTGEILEFDRSFDD